MEGLGQGGQDYRAFWTTEGRPGWMATIRSEANGWLRDKFGRDLDLNRDGIVRLQDKRLEIRHHEHGGEHAFRFEMEEENKGGRFVSTLTAVEGDRDAGWVSLDVISGSGSFVNRPKLAGLLLEVLDFQDGTPLSAQPSRVGLAGVEDVLSALRSAQRRGPVLVAGTDDQMPFDAFAAHVDRWTRETVGLAQTFVLDPLATSALNDLLGPAWGVPAWTIRTYLPELDLTSPGSARANRILGTARLGTDRDPYLARLLGGVARSVILERPVAQPWRAWQRIFDRVSSDAIKASAAPRPGRGRQPVLARSVVPRDFAPDIARLEAELERVRVTLELNDLREESLLEILDAATSERVDPASLADLQEELDRHRLRVETADEALDVAKARLTALEREARNVEEERDRLERRVRYLTRALVNNNLGAIAYGEVTEQDDSITDYGPEPTTYAELLSRIDELGPRGVVFTGDRKSVEDLQAIDTEGKALVMAWRAVVTLCEYRRAKAEGFQGSVHKFCEEQPIGYQSYPHNQHAATETGFTKSQYKGTRRFPVPIEVDRSGLADMYEHFKLARIDHRDPRMHYLDDSADSGTIYIGYLGVHLVNSMTAK